MKKIVPHLKLDHKVWALVEEVNGTNLIVNFQGDLIRVGNQSGKRFRPGQRIQLLVVSIQPLGFKLLESRGSKTTLRLDINI
jgi:hypothetical protein